MSTDFSVVCPTCKAHIHLGQRMAGIRFTAGYGPNDIRGQEEVGLFLTKHACHGEMLTVDGQMVPLGYKNEGSP